jgi:hypothetical protein
MRALSVGIAAFCIGCVHTHPPFVQGSVRIVAPVRQEESEKHTHRVDLFNDGGTHLFTITDAEGKKFDIYVDHRIGSSTPGAIYLRAYPGKPQSVRVLNREEFERKIGVFK